MAKTWDNGPWTAQISDGRGVFVESGDFTHDVRLYVNGDFRDEAQNLAYARWLADVLNGNQAALAARDAELAEARAEADSLRELLADERELAAELRAEIAALSERQP